MLLDRINRILQRILTVAFILLVLSSGFWYPILPEAAPETYSQPYQFNFLSWELNAFWNRALSSSITPASHMSTTQQRQIIDKYLSMVEMNRSLERSISENMANPNASKLADETRSLQNDLAANEKALFYHKRLAESVLQHQITSALQSLDLTQLGTALPPVLFWTSDLPKQLIVSPRETIRQEKSISLRSDISIK